MEPDWDKATELILAYEGFRPYPYDDARPSVRYVSGPVEGTLTIGYGETREDIVRRYIDNGGLMTQAEAFALFKERVPGYWTGFKRYLTVDLNPNQAAACTSMSYNAGPGGMAKNAPALLVAINAGRFEEAAEIWKTSIIMRGSDFETGLRRRRAAELALFALPYTGSAQPPAKDPWDDLFAPVLAQ